MNAGTPYGAMPMELPGKTPLAHTNPILEELKGSGPILLATKTNEPGPISF